MLTQEELACLSLGRWTVPLLAEILRHDGTRFADLVLSLGIARDSLARTLAHATESGWVARNPGHGHPLRPEYVLTPRGAAVAEMCQRMMAARVRLALPAESLPRWSLPILGELQAGQTRFTDLRSCLAPVTPRALSLNLKQMADFSLVTRDVTEGFPPASLYGLAPAGRALWASMEG